MTPHVPLHSEDYVVAAIFSIIVGVNALVLFPRVVPSLHRRLKRAALITGAIVSVLTFMIVIETRAMDHLFGGYFSFKTPLERLHEHFAEFDEKMARDPEIRRALESSYDWGMKLRTLNRLGVERLDDATLRRRARVMSLLLSRVSEHACATIVRGSSPTASDQAEIEEALLRLEAGFVAEWMQVLHESMLAEVRALPKNAPTDEERIAAGPALEAKLGKDTARRLIAGLSEGASDSERCWAMKTIYAVAPTLPEPHATVLLRDFR